MFRQLLGILLVAGTLFAFASFVMDSIDPTVHAPKLLADAAVSLCNRLHIQYGK